MHPNTTSLNIGGMVAIGFDETGRYMLVVSHAGRGVFEVGSWERVAHPEDGIAIGIGPIAGERVSVEEIDYSTGRLAAVTPDGRFRLVYNEGVVAIALVCN